ncbi:acyl-[acyl-carrier-protein] thioesterase [candidate division KSB1 bacterium]
METKLKGIWRDHYYINSYDVDTKLNLKLSSLNNFMQDIAWKHAEHLKFGWNDLDEKGSAWVLTRLKIIFKQYPQWGEEIILETWPLSTEHYIYHRDFRLSNKNDQICVLATSSWIIIDRNTRRPAIYKNTTDYEKIIPNIHAIEKKAEKIPLLNQSEREYIAIVGYSCLDMNQHANNAQYIDWIMDAFPLEMHQKYNITEFQINYLSEILYGEELAILKESIDTSQRTYRIEGFNLNQQKASFRALVKWEAIS